MADERVLEGMHQADLGAECLTPKGDKGLEATFFANSCGIPPVEHNAEGEGLGEGVLPTPVCTRQVQDNSLTIDRGPKGDEIAIHPTCNVVDDWEHERLLEDLGVQLVDPRGRPLRVVVDSRDEQTSGKRLNTGMMELLRLHSDVNYDRRAHEGKGKRRGRKGKGISPSH